MGQFTLIKRNGTRIPLNKRIPFCAVKTAQQSRSLMADDTVTLEVVSTFLIDFEKGDKIKIDSDWYTIRTTVDRTKNSEDQYNYSITLYGCIYDLMKVMFRDTDVNGRSTSLTFDLTYSIKDFVKVIIYNMNRDYPGEWVFDDKDCPETEPKTVSFSCQNCLQTLQNECKDFDVDFQITTDKDGIHHIKIGKFGSVVTPPNGEKYFQWGRGHGLFTLVEGKVDDKAIITRMYGEGGTNNIPTAYRNYSERLQLPYPQRLNKHDHKLSDGTVVKAKTMQIGCTDDNKRYIEDAALSKKIGVEEDAIQNDDIYPRRTGKVTALGDDVYTFMDDTMDFDLKASNSNGTTYLIDGTSAKITFITGRLAGREFELHDYDHSSKKFILKPYKDARGLVFPTSNTTAFQIREGDQYKITDIIMPDSYIEDAEEDLWFYVYDKFLQAKQARAQYALTFSRSYFIENMPKDSDSCLFTPGDYVPIKDERFNLEKNIRIQKVERNLLLRHDYTLTISDTATISIINQAVINVQKHDTILEANRLKDLTRAKYGWRTTEELRNMIYDPDGYFDTDNIKPNSIDTNMLTVGSKSQQFVLADVIMQANLGGDPNLFKATSGTLCHLSISDTDIRYWKIAALEATLSEAGGYYLFAKCSKKGDTGSWYLTQEQLKFEPTSDPNNYYFQVGVLSSVYDASWRDFVTTYGFTRINGNTITTGKIVTSDGYCYLDLDGNKFRMGDKQSYIDYNVQQRGQITLHNVRLLSTSGDSSEIGVYRGEYNASYVYYKGDEVSYTNNGVTATYRYIYSEPTKGYAPTVGTYWQCIAKGKDGEAGETPKIGDNGNWWIGSVDTGIKAEGVDGKGVNILGSYDSEAELKAAHPKGSPGDAYIVAGDLYSWDDVHKVWKNGGRIKGDAGDTPYIMNGYWWIGATNTGVKAKGEDAVMYEILPSVRIYSDTMVAAGDSLRVSLNKITGSNTENLTSLPKGFSLTLFGYGTDHIGKPTSKAISLDASYKLSDLKTSLKANMSLEVVLAGTNQVIVTKISMPYVKDGEKGTPGAPGEDGRTSYTHFKYSNDGGLSFTGNNGEEPGSYLGQYTDFEEMDSSNPTRYTWALIQGEAGNSGVDAAASSYFECRYAKNGSTVEPPTLDATALEPTGWSLQMPSVGKLEYLWMSMAQKSKLVEQTYCHIPFTAKDGCKDITGNYTTELGSGGSIVTEGDRQYLSLPDDSDLRIKYDLPFGENFTLFFWFKTDQKKIGWAIQDAAFTLNMKEMDVKPGTWMHLAFRFSDRTVSCFLNGVRQATASLNKKLIGFTVYDSNMYASANCYDEFRMVNGALADVDIVKVYQDKADKLLSNWSVPTRISPYDGKDGVSVMARYSSDKQNWHTSFQTGDQWMQTSSDSGNTWGEACKIVGEAGANGKYTDYSFATSKDLTTKDVFTSPRIYTTWSDAPVATTKDYPYLWMKVVEVDSNGKKSQARYTRLTGDPGKDGVDGVDSKYIYLRGTGMNRTADGQVTIYNGTKTETITCATRGLTLVRVDRSSLAILETYKCDTYSNVDSTLTAFAKKIKAYNSECFVCLVSYDAVAWNDSLIDALKYCGGTDLNNRAQGRYPFAFLGIPGMAQGYAQMIQSSDSSSAPYAEISAYIANRMFSTAKAVEETCRLDLSNENETVTCDSSGKVIGSIQGTQATLYKGSSVVSGVSYSCSASGCSCSFSTTTGKATNIDMSSNKATLKISCTYDGVTYSAVYTISKVYPGKDGSDAVSRYLDLSCTSVKVDKSGNVSPSKITAKQMKQVGGKAPENTADLYLVGLASSKSTATQLKAKSITINVSSSDSWVDFTLKDGSGNVYDTERVPVVKDGKDGINGTNGKDGINGTNGKDGTNGTDGKDGRDGIDGKDGRDGTDGYSLAPIYRGEYSASKTYYGTQYRVDIVKYNGIYYVARVDAGTFSNVAPTNTSKWNPFGAQFESIATNLLLAEGANIGDWFLSGGKIVSTLSTTSSGKITLDAKGGLIQVESATSGGDHSLYTSMGAKITLDANRGVIQATAKNAPSYSTGTAYMSPSGIFANMAGTDSISASTGRTHRSAIVGLGFANVSKSAYELNADETLVAGVYGRADNSGTAPAYGGYFWDLKACGLILNTKFISDNSSYSDRCLSKSVSFVIGLCNKNVVKDVYLPNDTKNGRIIKFKQMGAGAMRVRPMSGQHIYDDTSENDYYTCEEGQCLEFVFGIWVKGSTTTNVWTVSKYKYF